MAYKTLIGIGQIPKLTLVNKYTRMSVVMNHINSAEIETTSENFYAMKKGLKSVAFAKPSEGTFKVGAELTSDFIMKELYNMNLVEAKVGNGTTIFSSKEYVTSEIGVVPALDAKDVPIGGTMAVFMNDVKLKLVPNTPKDGEYSYDSITRVITLKVDVPAGVVVTVEGKVLDETKKRIEFQGTSTPSIFEAYLDLFEVSDEDGEVTKTTVYIGKLAVKKVLKLTASVDSVSDFSFEGDILVAEDENMLSLIN